MQLNIEKNNFCQLEGISNIKNHLEKLSNVVVNDSKATGNVEINVSYNDFEGLECFKSLDFPFELDLESLKILEVLIGHVNVYLVEGQGLDINYELVINYLPLEQVEEIKVIGEEDIQLPVEEKTVLEKPQESLEKIKEDMMEYYEDKLASNLNRGDKVIATKTHESVESFLNFFDSKQSYYKLKCLYVETEQELETIAKEYNVKLEVLLAGYDRQSHKVIFSYE
ncbi:MAG: hypothetical protein K2I88_02505 [Anaeroplasmataceae bacterium]|nr:hypothetical protein [Anaeroplasmataceae bacterium]